MRAFIRVRSPGRARPRSLCRRGHHRFALLFGAAAGATSGTSRTNDRPQSYTMRDPLRLAALGDAGSRSHRPGSALATRLLHRTRWVESTGDRSAHGATTCSRRINVAYREHADVLDTVDGMSSSSARDKDAWRRGGSRRDNCMQSTVPTLECKSVRTAISRRLPMRPRTRDRRRRPRSHARSRQPRRVRHRRPLR